MYTYLLVCGMCFIVYLFMDGNMFIYMWSIHVCVLFFYFCIDVYMCIGGMWSIYVCVFCMRFIFSFFHRCKYVYLYVVYTCMYFIILFFYRCIHVCWYVVYTCMCFLYVFYFLMFVIDVNMFICMWSIHCMCFIFLFL